MSIINGNQIAPDQITDYTGSLAGLTSGNVTYHMIQIGSIKIFIGSFNDYVNDSTVTDYIPYPIYFSKVPTITMGSSGLPTVSTTAKEAGITGNDTTTAYNGTFTIMGF